MVRSGYDGMDIGVGTIARGVALEHAVTQHVHARGHVHAIALLLHGSHGVEEGLEHRQVGGRAHIACIGREVENHDGDFALGAFAAAQGHQLGHACGQHPGALGAGVHVLGAVAGLEGAALVAAGAGHARRAGAATEDHGVGRTVKLGDGDHDGALHRQQAAIRAAPLVQGLEFHRVRCDVGHVQFRQCLLRGFGVVVGGATDQRETGERDNRVHAGFAVVVEKLVDRGAAVQAGGKGRNHPHALGFQG